ncbi:hypothetical protein K8O68_07985 [Salipaludibacillus sp. CUR1]|uniref:hypothetical protein n=1 Tax=Salipaludibacillus sp. CUR1 TaxID=2820003 RepID=UPI001E539211|nr:hypothetical protein [Salipaludibacillus sp. CUR1]MCE7792357.1 hypothetical protein [Salipaludibacillus sp. CUR1]
MSSAKEKNRRTLFCPSCNSPNMIVISKARYMIMMTVLPVIVSAVIAVMFHPVFLLFIPGLIWMNKMIADRKAPLIICRECKAHSQGNPAANRAH